MSLHLVSGLHALMRCKYTRKKKKEEHRNRRHCTAVLRYYSGSGIAKRRTTVRRTRNETTKKNKHPNIRWGDCTSRSPYNGQVRNAAPTGLVWFQKLAMAIKNRI